MATFSSSVVQPAGRTFIAFLFRDSDGFIYNKNGDPPAFEGATLSDLQGAARAPYRNAYDEVEDAPGSYTWSVDISLFQTGDYSYEARELFNNTEYANIKEDKFTIVVDPETGLNTINTSEIKYTLNTDSGRALFVFIKQISSGFYYKSSDNTFSALSLTTANEATRLPYRTAYNELDPPAGEYVLTLNGANFPNGNYEVTTYEFFAETGIEVEAASSSILRIQDSKIQIGITFDTTALSEDTGGEDTFRYVDPAGNPIEEATVIVYKTSDYGAGNFDNPEGSTLTLPNGRWADAIRVKRGINYTIVFHKAGLFGPDPVTVDL